MLVAEAPGWRGNAVTGIPFTSLRELTARPGLVTGAPDGDGFAAPAAPAAAWEASSRVVWAALADWPRPLPVSWPVYPHHPHQAGRPHTNRTPRSTEVAAGAPVALALMAALRIERVVAVGRKAEHALARHGVDAIPVRHPAQGGARRFTEQLAAIAAEP
jgi:uracil-DNA glycosylase